MLRGSGKEVDFIWLSGIKPSEKPGSKPTADRRQEYVSKEFFMTVTADCSVIPNGVRILKDFSLRSK
jgi:hypothetical protein